MCMCYTATKYQKTQSLFDEFSYFRILYTFRDYLQRCFNHLILLTFIEKFKISEINKISCGCLKNNMEYGILEKKLRDIGLSKICT